MGQRLLQISRAISIAQNPSISTLAMMFGVSEAACGSELKLSALRSPTPQLSLRVVLFDLAPRLGIGQGILCSQKKGFQVAASRLF